MLSLPLSTKMLLSYGGAAHQCLKESSTLCGASASYLVSQRPSQMTLNRGLCPKLVLQMANQTMPQKLRAGLGSVSNVTSDREI